MPNISFRPSGITFVAENFIRIKEDDPVELRHVPKTIGDKEYPDAIEVWHEGRIIGHVPESLAPTSAQQVIVGLLKNGQTLAAKITAVQLADKDTKLGSDVVFLKDSPVSALIDVSYLTPDFVLLNSINEPGVTVQFYPNEHKYMYEGRKLMGATTYIKRFFEEFDGTTIAKRCEKSWGVPANEILALWDSKGDIAAQFGSSIHAAIEHFHNHHYNGALIHKNAKNKDCNDALPKHPILRGILEDYWQLHSQINNYPHEAIPEAFLTNIPRGLCGLADLLIIKDRQRKICKIEDFKVNVDPLKEEPGKLLPPFSDMPNNKISKVTLQLNTLAMYMRESGWTVDSLGAYYLADTRWEYFDIELKGKNAN